MIRSVNLQQQNINFTSEWKKKHLDDSEDSHILPNNVSTRVNQTIQKTESAVVDYPVKGLSGSVNSNFYEFLTMGIVPYLAGSAMFMVLFNVARKYIDLFASEKAGVIGKKLGLGVVLYGIMKNWSSGLVTRPVRSSTGVDIEMPYVNKVFNLPTSVNKESSTDTVWQQRKVYDSKEFFRNDLLRKEKGYFEGVARRLGMGDNLNDAESEVTPIIQNIVSTTKTAKSISTYCWGALGVCLAAQDSWIGFFDAFKNRKRFAKDKNAGFMKNAGDWCKNAGKNTWVMTKKFGSSFGKACAQLWKGPSGNTGFMKHAGKGMILGTAFITAFLTSNAIRKAKKMAKMQNTETIDKTKESTVI